MEKFAILAGYFEKQMQLVTKLYNEIVGIDTSVYEKRFMFALKMQQFYTALEDLFKQIAKAFENNVNNLESFHKELLLRMSSDIPHFRPAVLSKESYLLLDKIRAFRHFVRHAYDCELDPMECELLQKRLQDEFARVHLDLTAFQKFVDDLAK